MLFIGVYLTGIYGGYFGAAQGVILIALLAILVADEMQRLNGLKIVLAAAVNGIAAILFIAVTPVAWTPAILIAIGSIVGGQLGAHVGRRLSPFALRTRDHRRRDDGVAQAAPRLSSPVSSRPTTSAGPSAPVVRCPPGARSADRAPHVPGDRAP